MSEIGARISGQRPLRPAISHNAATTTSEKSPRSVEAWLRTQRATTDSRGWSASSSRPIAGLAIERSGDQAGVDVLHRVRRHVVRPNLPQVVRKLLQHLLVHLEALRHRHALDMQLVHLL